MEREDVYKLIDGEREYQNKRWIDDKMPSGTHVHTPEEWIVYMEDYLAEATYSFKTRSSRMLSRRDGNYKKSNSYGSSCNGTN